MRVRAVRVGFYGLVRRRVGDVFTLDDDGDFSAGWMERVEADTLERTTTAAQALQRAHDERSAVGRVVVRFRPVTEDDDDETARHDGDPWV